MHNGMSELTEHTLANEIEAPHEILRKQASQIPVWRIKKIGSCSKGGLQWGFGFLC